MTVATTVSRHDIREGSAVTVFVGVHTIADCCAELFRICQNAGDGARGDINYVVNGAPALREAGQVSRHEAETFLASDRSGRDPSIQPKQISNRAGVFRAAAWTNRGHVLDQRKQVECAALVRTGMPSEPNR